LKVDKFIELFDKLHVAKIELTEEELKMSQSKSFKKFEAKQLHSIQNLIEVHFKEKKTFLQSLEKNHKKPKKSKSSWLYFLIATFIGLFLSSIYYLNKSNQEVNPNLYAQYYEYYPSSHVNRSIKSKKSQFEIAMEEYNRKNYSSTVEFLKNIDTDSALFYKGLAFMELKKFELAIKQFQNIQSLEHLPFKYYLSLCYLQKGLNSKAIKALNEVPLKPEYYKAKAQSLQNNLLN